MDDQDERTMDPGGEYQDSDEKAKKILKDMIGGFQKLIVNMDNVAEGMKAAQLRHASTLASIGDHSAMDQNANTPLLEAILDITSSMASAQILGMEMGQQQLKMTMQQMEGIIDLA